jgi:hypothetical protein
MALFSKKVPQRKWIDVAPLLGIRLKTIGNEFYQTFLSHTTIHGLTPLLSETALRYIDMLQLSCAASTIVENNYVSDPTFFLELVYIAMTGRRLEQMHADIEEYQFDNPGQTLDDPQASLIAWASTMAKELLPGADDVALATELVSYGAWLVVETKISTCETCGDHRGAEKVRRAMR